MLQLIAAGLSNREIGEKLFKNTWGDEIKELKKLTAVTKIDTGFLLSDTNGVWIYLIEGSPKYDFNLNVVHPSVLGNNMGLSLETTDFAKSSQIWQTVGFVKSDEQVWIFYF